MTTVAVTVDCPQCGVPNARRETLAQVLPGCIVAPTEITWCRACRFEIRPDIESRP